MLKPCKLREKLVLNRDDQLAEKASAIGQEECICCIYEISVYSEINK